jgi:hypothetical protein
MSGLRTSRATPADISIAPRQWEAGHGGGVKKTSRVTVNRPIGDNVKLGLLIRKLPQRVVILEFWNATTDDPIGRATNVTDDPQWSGALEALRRFNDPGTDNQWVLFELPPGLDVEFTSEFTLAPPPTPPDQQAVPVVAIHVDPNDPAQTVRARMRQGLYGYGVSVVRASDHDWDQPAPEGRSAPESRST